MTTTILREARIIMPTAHALPGKVYKASLAHKGLRKALANTFGGYTTTNGAGGWIAPDGSEVTEGVVIYDVAVPTNDLDGSSHKLARIALAAGRALGQHSVYVRYPHGVVAILEVDRAEEELSRGGPIGAEDAKSEKRPHDATVGDIWETRDGSLVAFTRFQGHNDIYLYGILFKQGNEVALLAGANVSYIRKLNGAFARSNQSQHALDLVKLRSTF